MLGQQNFPAPSPGRFKMHQKLCWPVLGIFLSTKPAGFLFYYFSFLLGFFIIIIFSAYLALKAGVGAHSLHFHCVTKCNLGPELRQCPAQPGFHRHLAIGSVESNFKTTGNSEKNPNLTVSSCNLGEHCNEILSILIPGEFWDGFACYKGVERSSSVTAFQTDSFSLSPLQLQSKSFPKMHMLRFGCLF